MPVTGYVPRFAMPIVAAPPSGDDPAEYYKRVLETTSFVVTPVTRSGLKIELSNDLYKGIFAMAGGEITFVPPGNPLPNGELSPGTGSLVLETYVADFAQLRRDLPPNVPPMAHVLYLNVNPTAVRRDLIHPIQALPTAALELAWQQPNPGSREELEQNFLDRLLLGQTKVFVRGGSEIGDAQRSNPADPTSKFELTLMFMDSAGVDLFPLLHLRSMPAVGGDEWTGHPLITQTATLPVPLDVYLQFEIWTNGTKTYERLPAGITIRLMDSNLPAEPRPLTSQVTDASGQVHLHLPNLGALDDPTPDLFFLVETNGMSIGGHVLPQQWSTKGWNATDGSAGYYPEFAGMQIGNANVPLVFRIGLDLHIRLTYEDVMMGTFGGAGAGTISVTAGSRTVTGTNTFFEPEQKGHVLNVLGDKTAYKIDIVNSNTSLTLVEPYIGSTRSGKAYAIDSPAPMGVAVSLFEVQLASDLPRKPGDGQGIKKADLITDDDGEIHTLLFNVTNGDSLYFHLDFSVEDQSINLPKAVVRLSPNRWDTSWTDADRLDFVNIHDSSIASPAYPRSLRCSVLDRNIAMYFLKITREWSQFLFHITGATWQGVQGLTFTLLALDGTAFAWPVGFVNVGTGHRWSRGSLAHELSHQIMWKEVDVSTLGIVYEALRGCLKLEHYEAMLANPTHALIEGWAEFIEAVFSGRSTPPYSVSTVFPADGGPSVPLGPPPDNRGESVEGAFANALWAIFEKYVVTPGVSTNAHVPESVNGNILSTPSWITNHDVSNRFRNMIWQPLKDLRPISGQPVPPMDTTTMIDKIRNRNLAIWPALQTEFQNFNLAR